MTPTFLWATCFYETTLFWMKLTCTGDNTVFVIQICNESNKGIFCLRTNALLVGTFLSIDDIRVSITINTQLFSFTKITSLYLVFKLTSAVFSKYWSWIQTFSTSFKILPTTFSTKSSTDTWLSFVGDKTSFLEHFISSWTGEGTCSDLMALESWCKLFKEVLRLLDLCFRLNCLLVERSEYRDLFGVPLFARLSKTFLNGCLDGVTKASTCQSLISVKLKMLIQWIEYNWVF